MSTLSEAAKSHIQYALRVLGRRSYSSTTMRRKILTRVKLKRRMTTVGGDSKTDSSYEDEVQEAMNYLTAHKLLDDDAFARSFIDAMRQRHKSDRWIMQRLMQHGLMRETISLLLTPVDVLPVIMHHITHKLSFYPDALMDKNKRVKLTRWLLGKGFVYHDVVKAMDLIQSGTL